MALKQIARQMGAYQMVQKNLVIFMSLLCVEKGHTDQHRLDHIRDIFYRMGWNDQEIVALSGAHALGRCHPDRSGFKGPWTPSPTLMTNDYFKRLLNEKYSLCVCVHLVDQRAHGESQTGGESKSGTVQSSTKMRRPVN